MNLALVLVGLLQFLDTLLGPINFFLLLCLLAPADMFKDFCHREFGSIKNGFECLRPIGIKGAGSLIIQHRLQSTGKIILLLLGHLYSDSDSSSDEVSLSRVGSSIISNVGRSTG